MKRLAGMLTILRALPGQRGALFVDRDELERRRDRAVRETVLYAARHVPYYRNLFRQEGIDPRDIRGAGDLSVLPPLPREQVLRDPARFRSDAPEARDGVTLQSSGTTGVSLSLFHDRRSVLLNVANSERERAVETALMGKRLRYTRLFLSPNTVENVNRIRGLAARESFRPFRPRYRQEHVNRPREELLGMIERIRPDVLAGSGSVLEAFFRVAAEHGPPRHLPRVVVFAWDAMTVAGRRLIEDTFAIPVLSRYSAMECLKIGFFCELRRGFHLHEDLCHVRAIRSDGSPAPTGETGELLLSNLFNRGSVLLNYRIGDRGTLSDEPCSCGRSARLLVDLDGRVNEVIQLPDGSIVGAMDVSAVVGRVPGLLRFQVVQRARTSFDLELSTVEPAAYDDAAQQAVAALRLLLPGCEVRAVHRDDIPLAPGRKHRFIVALNVE
jgi:phenylacetate-CoA ligase